MSFVNGMPLMVQLFLNLEVKVVFDNVEKGINYQVEIDEQTGFQEKVITESKNKKIIPSLIIEGADGEVLRSYSLPLGAHLIIDNGDTVEAGKVLVKIPRKSGKAGDITGGLPRVTELFEARNPSNPAVVAETDGVVSFGKIKRGNREIIVESKLGDVKKVFGKTFQSNLSARKRLYQSRNAFV